MILSACTIAQFNELPHYRWVSLPGRNEVKIGNETVAVNLNGECSFKTFKTAKEARVIFESFVSQLKRINYATA
jgi:hypothetical protein